MENNLVRIIFFLAAIVVLVVVLLFLDLEEFKAVIEMYFESKHQKY